MNAMQIPNNSVELKEHDLILKNRLLKGNVLCYKMNCVPEDQEKEIVVKRIKQVNSCNNYKTQSMRSKKWKSLEKQKSLAQ